MSVKYVNFRHLVLVSVGFLGLYMSLYTAQNLSSTLFSKDSYTHLGFYSNAMIYFGQGLGSFLAVFTIDKYSDTKTMAFGALVCIPFVLSLFIPAFNENPQSHKKSWIFSEGFVYTLILATSLLNGIGEGAAQTA